MDERLQQYDDYGQYLGPQLSAIIEDLRQFVPLGLVNQIEAVFLGKAPASSLRDMTDEFADQLADLDRPRVERAFRDILRVVLSHADALDFLRAALCLAWADQVEPHLDNVEAEPLWDLLDHLKLDETSNVEGPALKANSRFVETGVDALALQDLLRVQDFPTGKRVRSKLKYIAEMGELRHRPFVEFWDDLLVSAGTFKPMMKRDYGSAVVRVADWASRSGNRRFDFLVDPVVWRIRNASAHGGVQYLGNGTVRCTCVDKTGETSWTYDFSEQELDDLADETKRLFGIDGAVPAFLMGLAGCLVLHNEGELLYRAFVQPFEPLHERLLTDPEHAFESTEDASGSVA
jgi:hypothetical protein